MIRILSKNVADKIAAGEVVDRPLSVIKELVENAIDAGADAVTVEIRKGGKEYIRVTDNGCGIPAAEAELAFMRHATSKIVSDKDLMQVRTLGFRGEALASIAAVSRTELVTKIAKSKTGILVRFEGGERTETKAIGAPEGTTVTVANLFYNMPARLKFMRSDSAESALIIDFLSKTALAYPKIKFTVINNGKIFFSTNGNGDTYRNVLAIYGSETAKELIPIEKASQGGKITGYISNPTLTQSNRKKQIFFVNGRSIQSKSIEKGIDRAYAERLSGGRFPVAFLFLDLPPETLDVNIHPNKLEIRFDNDAGVTELVYTAIQEALTANEAIPQMRAEKIFKIPAAEIHTEQVRLEEHAAPEMIAVKETVVDVKKLLSTLRDEQTKSHESSLGEEPTAYIAKPTANTFDFGALKPTGIVFGTYITAVSDEAIYLFDQHAAHERVLFENIKNQYATAEKMMQPLLLPLIVQASPAQKSQESLWLEALRSMSFDIEEFGLNAYHVRGIPLFMELSEAEQFLQSFIENAGDSKGIFDEAKTEKIAMAACKQAVKANDKLSPEGAAALMRQLSLCENPYSCPHGRPTFVKITKNEIEKLFKRT